MEMKSIYKCAANDGLKFGGYLTLIFVSYVLLGVSTLFAWMFNLLILAIPFVTYRFIKGCYKQRYGCMTISEMWMYGMLLYIYAALICGLVTYCYISFIEPNFLMNQVQMAIDLYKELDEPSVNEMVVAIQDGVDKGLLPTTIDFVVQMIWMTSFGGSILSLILSFFVRLFNKNK